MDWFTFDWQTLVALGIVLIAIAALARKAWKSLFHSTTGCGTSCGHCPASENAHGVKVTKLIQLDSQTGNESSA